MDKRQQLESFQKDQARNGKTCYSNINYTLITWMAIAFPLVTGKRSNQWNMIIC